MLEDLEIKILGQRIHEILIRHRGREFRLGADAFDGGGKYGLEPLALMPKRLHLVGWYRLRDRLDMADPVRPAVILRRDPELLDAAQDDVVSPVGERL